MQLVYEFIEKNNYNIDFLYIDKFWESISNDNWIYINDIILEWMGYSKNDIKKGKLSYTKLLENNFNNEDYKLLNSNNFKEISKSFLKDLKNIQINEHNKVKHLIVSPKCFKKSLMLLKTNKSNEIRDYYIDLEDIFKNYIKYQNNYQKLLYENEIKLLKDNQEEILINNNFKTNSLIDSFKDKSVVYLAKIGINEIKFGHTNNIHQRFNNHVKFFELFELLHIKECSNNKLIESKIKQYAKDNNILINKTIKNKNITELIEINDNININNLINQIEIECNILEQNKDNIINELTLKIEELTLKLNNIIKSNNEDNIKKLENIETIETIETIKEKKYKCEKCPYSTNLKFDFNVHLNRQVKCDEIKVKKQHICPKCNKDFLKPSKLEAHINKKSSCDIILKCEKCEKIFKNIHNLTQHINKQKSCI